MMRRIVGSLTLALFAAPAVATAQQARDCPRGTLDARHRDRGGPTRRPSRASTSIRPS